MESELRELLEERAGEMRVEPAIPAATLRRARRRRTRNVAAAGGVAVALGIAGLLGAPTLLGTRPAPGGFEASGAGETEPWRGLWPQASREEARKVQALADQGRPEVAWQRDASRVVERFNDEVLGWERVFIRREVSEGGADGPARVELHIGDCEAVGEEPCPNDAKLALERLVRPDRSGIWTITDAQGPEGPIPVEPSPPVVPTPSAAPLPPEAEAFVRGFMDARLAGSGAEALLSPEAAKQYSIREGGLSLYAPEGGRPYAGYEVVRIAEPQPGSLEAVVRVIREYTGQGAPESFAERLRLGPREDGEGRVREPLVLAASREPQDRFPMSPIAYGSPRVRVVNGTAEAGLAAHVAEELEELGYEIAAVGNAARGHRATILFYRGDSYGEALRLMLTRFPGARLEPVADPDPAIDMTLVVGEDLAARRAGEPSGE